MTEHKEQVNKEPAVPEESRRHFVNAGLGISLGVALLSLGTVEKVFRFFFGPRLTGKEETEMMAAKLDRLKQTTAQRQLELERQEKNYILVATVGELSPTEGKYFIDFQMRPAMAFLGKDNLPLLISAKCTHLGCTVGNQVDAQGKILCPCHVSYFNVETGQPNPEAPAKAPLAHLGWVVMDKQGKVLASRTADGVTSGSLDASSGKIGRVYIAKNHTTA